MWRDWFTFSRQDRRAILLLAVLIMLVLALHYIRPMCNKRTLSTLSSDSTTSLLQPSTPIVKIAPHLFDPNTADSLELLTVGLPPHVVRNIQRYRAAGGQFRRPNDLARIYGLHDTVFTRIRPYIDIPLPKQMNNEAKKGILTGTDTGTDKPRSQVPPKPAKHEHPYAQYMKAKNNPGQFVDLNLADTTEFMKIPGIGPVYAKMIVDYRQRLGGFHNISQLKELDALPEDIGDWVHVSMPPKDKLRINRLSVTQLRSHPYISFYQAKAIIDLRKREGDIKSTRQLLFLNEFTEDDILRLTPYLSFE